MHREDAEPEPANKRVIDDGERGGLQDPDLRQVLPEHPLSIDPRQGPPQARRHPLLPHRQGPQPRPRRPRRLFRPTNSQQHQPHPLRRIPLPLPLLPPQFLNLHPPPPP
ncbi:hypothetical protein S245_002567 [Arachis hypogaea]